MCLTQQGMFFGMSRKRFFLCEDSHFCPVDSPGNHGKSMDFQGLDFVFQRCLVRKLGESLQVVDAVVAGEAAVARSMQETGLCYQWNMGI